MSTKVADLYATLGISVRPFTEGTEEALEAVERLSKKWEKFANEATAAAARHVSADGSGRRRCRRPGVGDARARPAGAPRLGCVHELLALIVSLVVAVVGLPLRSGPETGTGVHLTPADLAAV